MADDKPKAVRGPGGKFLNRTEAAPGSFVWAADHIVNGRTVRRASWIGNKSISALHPSRNILENEDFLANDWELV